MVVYNCYIVENSFTSMGLSVVEKEQLICELSSFAKGLS